MTAKPRPITPAEERVVRAAPSKARGCAAWLPDEESDYCKGPPVCRSRQFCAAVRALERERKRRGK